jgi:hypothetical protein
MPTLSARDVLCVVASLFLTHSTAGLSDQTKVEENQRFNHDIGCEIQVEHRQWNRNSETAVSGTIENLNDGDLELDVNPTFYLSPRAPGETGDKYWAPADVLHDSPIAINKNGGGIEPRPIHLRFKNKGDKIDFRVDAQHLLWAKVISSVWPSSSLFSTVKTGDYDLQLVMETENGRVGSAQVKVSPDVSKSPK